MDFQELLNVADYNRSEAKSEASVKRYSTVLAPPKKAPKSGIQSDAIKKFLQKKQAEEQQRVVDARKKKEELLALRSQNSKNCKKAKIMASRTKDNDFSKIKLTEDEIESKKRREVELLRMKLNDKVERMKARIEMEEREKMLPKKRKRKSKLGNENVAEGTEEAELLSEEEDKYNVDTSRDVNYKQGGKNFMQNGEHNRDISREHKTIGKKKPQPPSAPAISFQDLLRVAATKQYEPVELPEVDDDDDDNNKRPLTKKEKRLLQEETTRIQRKETQQLLPNNAGQAPKKTGADPKKVSNRPHELKMSHKAKLPIKTEKKIFDQDRNAKTKHMHESTYNRNNSDNTHEIYTENKYSNEISKREIKNAARSDYYKSNTDVTRQQSKHGNIGQMSSKCHNGINISKNHLNSELRHPAGHAVKKNISHSNESYEDEDDSDCSDQAFKRSKYSSDHISNREIKSTNQPHQTHGFKQKSSTMNSLNKYNVESARKQASLNSFENKQLKGNMVSEKEMYLKRSTERDMKKPHKNNNEIYKSPVKHGNVEVKQKTLSHSSKSNNSIANRGISSSNAFSTKLNGQSKSVDKDRSLVNGYNKNVKNASKRTMEEKEYLPSVSPSRKVPKLDKRMEEKQISLPPTKNNMKHKNLVPASERHSFPNKSVPPSSNRHVPSSSNRNVPPPSNRNIPPSSNRNVPPSSNRNVPPSSNRNVPPSSNRNVPPSSNRNVPLSPSKYVSSSPNKHISPSANRQTLSAPDRHAYPASNKHGPPSSNRQLPLSSNKQISSASDRPMTERKPSELRPNSKTNNSKMLPHEIMDENRLANRQNIKGDNLSIVKNEVKKPSLSLSKDVRRIKQQNSDITRTFAEKVPNLKMPPEKNPKQTINRINSAKSEIGKQMSFHSRPYESQYVPSKKLPMKSNRIERDSYPLPRNPYLDPPRRLLESRRPPVMQRRRIESDDDEEEDDDMSDFIDDGPCVDEDDDYSKYIKEIFGYDRSRYLDEDDDDEAMETSYAEQQKEEIRSAKIGHLEDLEDIRREEEELKRKQMKKKKKKT